MLKLISTVLLCSIGCASAPPVVQFSGIPEKQYVEVRDLPESPDVDPVIAGADWAVPLSRGECTHQDGILLSPEKAVRAKLWQEGYRSIRSLYELDRKVWAEHRTVYENRIKQANGQIKDVTPKWWDANEGNIAMAAGFVVGVLATVGITYAAK